MSKLPGLTNFLPMLVISQLGVHAAMAGVRMTAPLQALNEGHSAFWVGALLALYAAAPVFVVLPAGRMADRLGFHKPVQLAVALAMLGALIAAGSTWLASPWRFVGLGLSAVLVGSAANVSLIAVQRTGGQLAREPGQRMRVFSWLGVAPPFSNVLGPVLAGVLIDHGGFAVAYGAMALLPLLSLWASRRVPVQAPAPEPASGEGGTAWDLLTRPGMRRLLVVNWLFASAWDVHTFAVPVLGHARGFSASAIGLVLGLFTFSVAAVRMFVPLLARRLQPVPMLVSAMLATGVVMALYPLATTPWQMALFALALGLALGSVQPMVMISLHDMTPHHRHGQAIALRSLLMNLSSTAMPLVFGLAGAALGPGVLFWVFGGLVAAGAQVARHLPRQGQGQAPTA